MRLLHLIRIFFSLISTIQFVQDSFKVRIASSENTIRCLNTRSQVQFALFINRKIGYDQNLLIITRELEWCLVRMFYLFQNLGCALLETHNEYINKLSQFFTDKLRSFGKQKSNIHKALTVNEELFWHRKKWLIKSQMQEVAYYCTATRYSSYHRYARNNVW